MPLDDEARAEIREMIARRHDAAEEAVEHAEAAQAAAAVAADPELHTE